MKELRGVSEPTYVEMMDLLRRFWCKAFFDEDCKCDVDNNMCETFNSWILAARSKVIIFMIKTLIDQLMERFKEKRLFVETWSNDIAPRVMKNIKENTMRSMQCYVKWNRDPSFVVCDTTCDVTHGLDFRAKTCSCREWNLIGIPCPHVFSAIRYMN
ncbi:hypothetical protein SLE2022_333370 [Rubroshorea leprosula]